MEPLKSDPHEEAPPVGWKARVDDQRLPAAEGPKDEDWETGDVLAEDGEDTTGEPVIAVLLLKLDDDVDDEGGNEDVSP